MGFKSGFVAMVGRPNVGKSTLLNKLTGEKISIISSKPQTTRNKILSIKTTDDYQIVFVDTPGAHIPKTKLGEYMNLMVDVAVSDVDVAVLLCEATRDIGETERQLIEKLKSQNIDTILAVNKVDKAKKEELLPLIEKYTELNDFKAIVPISALKGDGCDALLEEILKLIDDGPMYYPEDQITDQLEREMAAEVIREKMLRLLDKEVPHGSAVEIESYKEHAEVIKISATIYCEKATHKPIIIGKGGETLKRIGTYARKDLEEATGKNVFLELWVKIKKDWRNKPSFLKEFGYKN